MNIQEWGRLQGSMARFCRGSPVLMYFALFTVPTARAHLDMVPQFIKATFALEPQQVAGSVTNFRPCSVSFGDGNP